MDSQGAFDTERERVCVMGGKQKGWSGIRENVETVPWQREAISPSWRDVNAHSHSGGQSSNASTPPCAKLLQQLCLARSARLQCFNTP